MAKITLDPILGSYASVTTINSRFQQIEDALNNNVLWRAGFTGEPNTMAVDLDMNGGSILNAVYDFDTGTLDVGTLYQAGVQVIDESSQTYLGASATAPTTRLDGVTAVAEGDSYYNSVDNVLYSYDGAGWGYAIPANASNAVDVALADAGANYAATNLEGAMAELANSTGAAIIGVADAGNLLTATDVEGSLAEIATRIGGLNTKVVEIVNWDMDATTVFTVAHGLTLTKIVSVTGTIINDAGTLVSAISQSQQSGTYTPDVNIDSWDATDISLVRLTAGKYDNVNYDSVGGYVRGHLVIQYID